MYRELEAKIAYRGISKKQMAEGIHMNYSTLLSKIGGKSKFTLDEAVSIKEIFGGRPYNRGTFQRGIMEDSFKKSHRTNEKWRRKKGLIKYIRRHITECTSEQSR